MMGSNSHWSSARRNRHLIPSPPPPLHSFSPLVYPLLIFALLSSPALLASAETTSTVPTTTTITSIPTTTITTGTTTTTTTTSSSSSSSSSVSFTSALFSTLSQLTSSSTLSLTLSSSPAPSSLSPTLSPTSTNSSSSSSSSSATPSFSSLPPCPGRYCGRVLITQPGVSGVQPSECGACPHAYKSDGTFCYPCTATISSYEILFLFINAVLLYLLHVSFLVREHGVSLPKFFSASIVVFFEVFIACIAAVLLQEPLGSLRLYSCSMFRISDWYPYLHNPRPTYSHELHCANEAAYPLVTWMLLVAAFNFLAIFVVRIPLFRLFNLYMEDTSFHVVFHSLYALPAVSVFHLLLGGVLYYAFPYILIAVGMVIMAPCPAEFFDKLRALVCYVCCLLGLISLLYFFNLTNRLSPIGYLLGPATIPTAHYLLSPLARISRFTSPE